MKKRNYLSLLVLSLVAVFYLSGCSNSEKEASTGAESNDKELTLEEITEKAKAEGEIASIGMPDAWANWKDTWEDLGSKYEIKHKDTDMSSAEELAKFESEGKNATADIGDVGVSFGPLAKEKDLTLAYKTSYWDEIPDWAKDDEGHWIVGYQGTIAFMTDKEQVKSGPKSWEDLKNGDYKIAIGDVTKANQAQFAVLAAAIANGGDEKNIEPGIAFFEEIAKAGRLLTTDNSVANLEKGEIPVTIYWDFNALGYRDQIKKERFDVIIPEEASIVSGYATIINKNAKNPNAAKLAREYILSDEGQANLAKGYARPIRDNVELPQDAKENLLPIEMYKNAKPVEDFEAWEETIKELPQLWQERVLVHVQ